MEVLNNGANPVDLVVPYAQEIDGSCGEACLVMVYRSLGERIDERQIVSEIQPDLGMIDSKYFGGSTHEQMSRNVELHGYKTRQQYNTTYEGLKMMVRMGLPVIVEWMSDVDGLVESDCHYSVVTHVNERMVKMADPSYGTWRKIGRNDFERKWRGYERDGSTTRHFSMIVFSKDK